MTEGLTESGVSAQVFPRCCSAGPGRCACHLGTPGLCQRSQPGSPLPTSLPSLARLLPDCAEPLYASEGAGGESPAAPRTARIRFTPCRPSSRHGSASRKASHASPGFGVGKQLKSFLVRGERTPNTAFYRARGVCSPLL